MTTRVIHLLRTTTLRTTTTTPTPITTNWPSPNPFPKTTPIKLQQTGQVLIHFPKGRCSNKPICPESQSVVMMIYALLNSTAL